MQPLFSYMLKSNLTDITRHMKTNTQRESTESTAVKWTGSETVSPTFPIFSSSGKWPEGGTGSPEIWLAPLGGPLPGQKVIGSWRISGCYGWITEQACQYRPRAPGPLATFLLILQMCSPSLRLLPPPHSEVSKVGPAHHTFFNGKCTVFCLSWIISNTFKVLFFMSPMRIYPPTCTTPLPLSYTSLSYPYPFRPLLFWSKLRALKCMNNVYKELSRSGVK